MSDDKAIEAFRLWYRLHTGKMLTRSNARKAVDSYLSALGDSEAGTETSLRNVQRSGPDRDSLRILQQFADLYREGAHGAEMDCDAAMSLALAIDDVLAASALSTQREPRP